MILTLTLNPAIDRTVSVDRLAFEDRAYINSTSDSAGGRGIVAASVIHSFGGKVRAVATAGGAPGARLQKLLNEAGFPSTLLPIAKATRTNLTITDKHGLTVNLNEAGPRIVESELDAIEAALQKQLGGVDWLMLCGSLPPGVPHRFYGRMVKVAREKGVKTLIVADGEALRSGIEAKPSVVTLTQHAAERLLNRALLTHTNSVDAVEQIRSMGAEAVLLYLGSRGAIAVNRKEKMDAIAPRYDALCPIGAGDALAAAYVWALDSRKTHVDALKWGLATAVASAHLPGMNFATPEQVRHVLPKIEIRPVD